MTSEEIKKSPEDARTTAGWLKEIAYQLAVSNEKVLKVENQPWHYPPTQGIERERLERNKPIYDRKAAK